MPSSDRLLLFSLAAAALIAIPGPSVLYVVARALRHGRRTGLVSVLGVETGELVHVVAATVGLSALIAASASTFTVVKLAGAAYLVVIGLRTWFGHGAALPDLATERRPPLPAWPVFRQGALVGALNPKTALFFVAFLPQFVEPARGSTWLQILVLGLAWTVIAIVSDSCYAIAAGALGGLLAPSRRAAKVERIVSGSIFVGLGVVAADAHATHLQR